MIISHKFKLIYSHIPKTGGASIKKAICNIDANSKNIKGYHSRITRDIVNKYPKYNKITVVRNSYQIVASRYRFREIYAKKLNKKIDSFKKWISISKSMVFNQLVCIKDKKGMLIDYILFYNNLNNDIKKLNKELNINLKIKNKYHYYGKYNYKDYYDKECKKIIYNRCKEDIEYFNWKF